MKKVILTGASDGLGLELAKQLLKRNIEVVGISRTKPSANVHYLKADLTKEDDIKEVVELVRKSHSDFDVLINCAAVVEQQELGKINYSVSKSLLELNLLAPLVLTSELIDIIRKNEADVVNVGSTIGFKAYEKQATYGMSKWGVRGLNTNLQLEVKNTKCRVIGFNPGGFKSKLFEKATGIKPTDWTGYMDAKEIAKFLIQILELPKNMEVSDIIINRK